MSSPPNNLFQQGQRIGDGGGNRPQTAEETTSMNNQPIPNQQRQQQDPRYARTQTPEFQSYVTQQNALNEQLSKYMQESPLYQQQRDLSGKMSSYMNLGQTDPFSAQSMEMPQIVQKSNFM